jgi:hypothetical protein
MLLQSSGQTQKNVWYCCQECAAPAAAVAGGPEAAGAALTRGGLGARRAVAPPPPPPPPAKGLMGLAAASSADTPVACRGLTGDPWVSARPPPELPGSSCRTRGDAGGVRRCRSAVEDVPRVGVPMVAAPPPLRLLLPLALVLVLLLPSRREAAAEAGDPSPSGGEAPGVRAVGGLGACDGTEGVPYLTTFAEYVCSTFMYLPTYLPKRVWLSSIRTIVRAPVAPQHAGALVTI